MRTRVAFHPYSVVCASQRVVIWALTPQTRKKAPSTRSMRSLQMSHLRYRTALTMSSSARTRSIQEPSLLLAAPSSWTPRKLRGSGRRSIGTSYLWCAVSFITNWIIYHFRWHYILQSFIGCNSWTRRLWEARLSLVFGTCDPAFAQWHIWIFPQRIHTSYDEPVQLVYRFLLEFILILTLHQARDNILPQLPRFRVSSELGSSTIPRRQMDEVCVKNAHCEESELTHFLAVSISSSGQ